MNMANQIALAMAGHLSAQTLPHSPQIDAGLSVVSATEDESRIVVIGTEATLRKPLLPGLYDITGSVDVIQSVDSEDAESRFHEICDSINSILGDKDGMPAILAGVDPELHVYSYNWTGSRLMAGSRRLLAQYNWTAFARNTPTTN